MRGSEVRESELEGISIHLQTNMDIVQYSFVNWEQVKGELPEFVLNPPSSKGI